MKFKKILLTLIYNCGINYVGCEYMTYGIVDGVLFSKIESEIRYDYLSLDEEVSNLESEFEILISCFEENNVNDLYKFYKEEIEELKKVNKKILKYNLALTEISTAYSKTSEYIYSDIIQTLSKIEGRDN